MRTSTHMHWLVGRLRLLAAAVLILCLAFTGYSTPVAQAAAIGVTTTADELKADSNCSLREAIIAANTDTAVDRCAAGSDTDTISLPAGTYTLSVAGLDENAAATGDLDITSNIIISGSGAAATVIDGGGLEQVVSVLKGATATIANVTIRNGALASAMSHAGGIDNKGTLTLRNTIVRDNRGEFGGGISNDGTLTITGSTVYNNRVYEDGAGIWNGAEGKLTIIGSTIRNNRAEERAGGVGNNGQLTVVDSTIRDNYGYSGGGGIFNRGVAVVRASTVNANQQEVGGGGGIENEGTLALVNSTSSGNLGGDIDNWNGTVAVNSSTIEGISMDTQSTGSISAGNSILGSCSGTLTSLGYSLIQNTGGCTIKGTTSGNRLNVDPKLAPLQNNGGSTFTRTLLAGSPAIDAANPALPASSAIACPATDQRGVVRAQDGDGNGQNRCDIGAYEVVAPNLLKNGSFENDANGDGRPDSWTSNSHFTRSSTAVLSGRHAGRHRASDNTGYTVGQTVLNLGSGTAYMFSGYVNIPTTSDSFTFRPQLRWRNASNSVLRTDTLKTFQDDTGGRWVHVWAIETAPSGTANARVQMVVSNLSATIYADSFAFRLAPTTDTASVSTEDEPVLTTEAELEQAPSLIPDWPDTADEAPN